MGNIPEEDGNLSGYDSDPDIKFALLDEEEVHVKTQIWTNENQDWLKAQEGKLKYESNFY